MLKQFKGMCERKKIKSLQTFRVGLTIILTISNKCSISKYTLAILVYLYSCVTSGRS